MKKLLISLIIITTTALLVYGGLRVFGVIQLDTNTEWGQAHHGYGFHGIGMGVFWLIVLFGLLYFHEYNNQDNDSKRSLSILNERYARGDIDKDTYQRMKKTMKYHD